MSSPLAAFVAFLSSLKARLALAGGVVLALGIASTSSVLISNAERLTIAERGQLELMEASRAAGTLSSRVVDLQRALSALAATLDERSLEPGGNLQAFFDSRPIALTVFSSLLVTDARGAVLLAFDDQGFRDTQANIGDRDYFRTAVQEQRPVVSDLLASRIADEPVVVLAQPLVRNGKVFGVVVGGVRIRRANLLDSVVDWRGQGHPVFITVTDASGHILAHPDPQLVGQPASAEPRLSRPIADWREMGAPAEPAGVDLSDTDTLAVAAAAAAPRWMVWRVQSFSDVLQPLRQGHADVVHWAVFCTVALAFTLLGLVWWFLMPLTRLEQRANRLFEGGLDPRHDWPQASGEVGRLERVLHRVTCERALLEADTAHALARLQSVMDSAPVGIAFYRDERFELVSAELCRLLLQTSAELLAAMPDAVFASALDAGVLREKVAQAFRGGLSFRDEVLLARRDGSTFWARVTGTPLQATRLSAGTIWTVIDITAEVAARQALEWAATHDPLTGLANRKGFTLRLARIFDGLPRSRPAALLVIDLDRFKDINDQYGHAAGDEVLRAVAKASALALRATDLMVRLGGDEFAVVLERCPPSAALQAAEMLLAAISSTRLTWGDDMLQVGASVGVAALTDAMRSPEEWVGAADRACYSAKPAGRNAVHVAAVHR